MKDFIAGHLEGPVANVLDPAGVQTLLADVDKARPAALWNLATVAAAAAVKTVGGARSPMDNSIAVHDAYGLKP